MKHESSILRQLLLNILVPVLGLFIVVFILTYRYNLEKLNEQKAQQRDAILAETRNLIAYFDFSMRSHERQFIDRMRKSAYQIQEELQSVPDPKTADLFTISRIAGLDSVNEHIYLIDRNTIIVNTTFPPDSGLNFSKIGNQYAAFFGALRKSGHFREDRFGLEMKTGRIKKYAFLATSNRQYIIELGFYSLQAEAFRNLLLKKIETFKNRYKGIRNVQLYLGVKGSPDIHMTDPDKIKAYLRCLEKRAHQRVPADDPTTSATEQTDFFYLPALASKLYSGYVLEIDSDDSQSTYLIRELSWRFLIFFFITGLLITFIVYQRAKTIVRPIRQLSESTATITRGNLDTQITLSGSAEVNQLATSFNTMIASLRQSYETLEEKVVQRTEEVVRQKQLVEHKNREIMDSIGYAQFIQQALLPQVSELHRHLPQSQVVYHPKDIISGDFYWFIGNETSCWFAVADCTGHGVPGAMVSVLCTNALNEQLTVNPGITTGELLDNVRDYVVRNLTNDKNYVNDGMDISLCRLNKQTLALEWSGANNPLWIFRGAETLVLQPDKQPVGRHEPMKHFTTHSISLQTNDLLVLFSDGFADQFGGPKGKKFKYAALRELIRENQSLSVEELKNILETTFVNWKGNTEQTDDVCLLLTRMI